MPSMAISIAPKRGQATEAAPAKSRFTRKRLCRTLHLSGGISLLHFDFLLAHRDWHIAQVDLARWMDVPVVAAVAA